eukprot:gnl/TRDRNA2_/TRDRNA2_130316_c0_seq2.p1 gnl/TRDRNA2_/TRDRNA2_130316_c0~~gnl/TRDRNA2_/TRDRNA2_130316_c0_seq2.p1  ORF type:complete len:963 (-),score=169.83 gnl/TRDRNA2_/TRDRNA2_130316_c0_seq2:125-3013(-)
MAGAAQTAGSKSYPRDPGSPSEPKDDASRKIWTGMTAAPGKDEAPDLPISSYRGRELPRQPHWSFEQPASIDQQLAAAAEKLRGEKDALAVKMREDKEASLLAEKGLSQGARMSGDGRPRTLLSKRPQSSGRPQPTPPPGRPLSAYGRGPTTPVVKPWVSQFAEGPAVPRLLVIDADPRYQEMAAALNSCKEQEKQAAEDNSEARSRPGTAKQDWQHAFARKLAILLHQLRMTKDAKAGEEQLDRAYEWYVSNKAAPSSRISRADPAPPKDFSDFCAKEASERHLPGSAFYVAPTDELLRRAESAYTQETSSAMSTAHLGEHATTQGQYFQMPQVHLPPAKERLRDFQTRHLIEPSSATARRNLPRDTSPEPWDKERPCTPSTATGGFSSARSCETSRPGTAMSMGSRPPSALYSRPPSAIRSRPYTPSTARSGTPRPDSAQGYTAPYPPSQPKPQTHIARPWTRPLDLPDPMLQEAPDLWAAAAEEEPIAKPGEWIRPPPTVPELNMQERWLMKRHQEVASRMIDEERHTAIAAWSERRARVEEEISRNAESARFQSELRLRGYQMPPDAREDIMASITPPRSPSPSDGSTAAPGPRQSQRAQSAVAAIGQSPRYDVSQVSASSVQVAEFHKAVEKDIVDFFNNRSEYKGLVMIVTLTHMVINRLSEDALNATASARYTHKKKAPDKGTAAAASLESFRTFDFQKRSGRWVCVSMGAEGSGSLQADNSVAETLSQAMKAEPEVRVNPKSPTASNAAAAQAAPITFAQIVDIRDRISYLRRIHAHLVDGPEDHEVDQDEPGCVFDTEDGARHISLSAYTPGGMQARPGDDLDARAKASPRRKDDTDDLASACQLWMLGGRQEDLRFQQLEEVEAIKRVMARRNIPFSGSLLERALVMPKHRIRPNVPLFNTKPQLLANPFPEAKSVKTKKKGGRRSSVRGSVKGAAGKKKAESSPGRRKSRN